jgi:hypothetical protein
VTEDEQRRLELARRAWQAARPTEDDVDRAVWRMAGALRGKERRLVPRRLPALVATALVLGGALAYAASGGIPRIGTSAVRDDGAATLHGRRAPAPTEVPAERKAPAEPATVTPDELSLDLSPPPLSPPVAPFKPKASLDMPSVDSQRTTSHHDGTWREVGEALAAGDDDGARRVLKGLALVQDDPATSAKARLGLARLAMSEGDCKRALRLALGVARTPGLDDKLVKRAHDIAVRCEQPQGPSR